MNVSEKTLSYLKAKGFKTTQVRTQIINLLVNSKSPLSVSETLEYLKKIKISPNKTTVYREIEFLLTQGIIKEIDFGESKKRYEFTSEQHHHHIVCVRCKRIDDVDLDQDLTKHENKITKEKNFKIINHSLEFFGVCSNCQ